MSEYRRRLPHFHPDNAYLFVTWRLHGSLPVRQPDVIYPTPGHAFVAQDRELDRSAGPRWLSDTRVARVVSEAILAGDRDKLLYELYAWVVMPNHVHVLLLPTVPLRQITQWIKGKTAKETNCLLGRPGGPFWQHESYDHWVRSERQFNQIAAYIEHNPVSAGFAPSPEAWPWSSAGAS